MAASARMRGSWAVMVRCPGPVALAWDGAFINTGPLRWVARDSSKPGRTAPAGTETWLLHASPEWSDAHEDAADSVTATLLAAFEALGGPAPRRCKRPTAGAMPTPNPPSRWPLVGCRRAAGDVRRLDQRRQGRGRMAQRPSLARAVAGLIAG